MTSTTQSIDGRREVQSWCPGTCGELVQGFCQGGKPFHITFPIKKYSTVKLIVSPDQDGIQISGLREDERKTDLALRKTAELLKLHNLRIHVERTTQLQIGKGMASSTADILSAADALATVFGETLTADLLALIATSIESSDGLMYPGLAAVDHKSGALVRLYDWYPQFNVIILIPPHTLNTESVSFRGKECLSDSYDEILSALDAAAVERDEAAFALAASKSAQLNQSYVRNEYFEKLRADLNLMGALGMAVAHTGTMAGIIFGSSFHQQELATNATAKLKQMWPGHTVDLTQVEGLRRWNLTRT